MDGLEKEITIDLLDENCHLLTQEQKDELRKFHKEREMVNHPSHYNQGKIEVIDAIEDWKLNFTLGSAVKYIARADYKANPIEDLKKAMWYIEREIQTRTNKE